MLSRRTILALAANATLALSLSTRTASAGTALRIGYQKSSVLALLKRRGTLEQTLASKGVTVTWSEFPSGPPLLEALGSGALDYGYTGDVPPISFMWVQCPRPDRSPRSWSSREAGSRRSLI
jgi:sulfonate transport system substrate-binding protein